MHFLLYPFLVKILFVYESTQRYDLYIISQKLRWEVSLGVPLSL